MTVSVIIPAYNASRTIVETVKSALSQSVPPLEVIVVNDGSTDNTAELLAQFGTTIHTILKPNGGVSSARNAGLAVAKGEYIAFLDSDDVWHPEKLRWQTDCLEANPDIMLLGTLTYDWPASSHPELPTETAQLEPIDFPQMVIKNRLTASSVIVRTKAIREVGDFDTQQHGTEDHDMWLRISQRYQLAVLQVPLTGYRNTDDGSLGKNARQMEAGMYVILNKLDTQGVFQNNFWLKRKSQAYIDYTAGFLYYSSKQYWSATRRLFQSMLLYPFAYDKSEVRYRLGRVKLLIYSVIRILIPKSL